MKKMVAVICIVVGVVLIAGVGFACHSKTSSAPDAGTPAESGSSDVKPEAEPEAPAAKAEFKLPDFDLQKEKEWISYYEDSELSTTDLFNAALAVLKEKTGASGEVSPFSTVRFANWFLLDFQAVVFAAEDKLDGEIEHGSAYLLDMSSKQVIGKDRANAMLPVAKRVIELVDSGASGADMLVHGLATAASAVFMGTAACYDNPGDDIHPKPTLKKLDEHTHVVKFFMVTGSQELPAFKECTVTITDSEITFKSEDAK